MKVNVYLVMHHTIFQKHDEAGHLKEVRRSSPTQHLAAGQTPEQAFRVVPVGKGEKGELAVEVNLGVQLKHSNVYISQNYEPIEE